MPEACGVSDGVGHERPLLSHPLARLRPRGCGYGVLWLVRAETSGSSETALLLLTLRWNEKSRGLGGDGGEKRPGQAPRVITGYFGSGAGAVWGCLVRRGARMWSRNEWWGKHHEWRYAGTTGCCALIDVAANNLSLLATISLVFLYKILYVPRWIPPPIVRDLELH